MEECDRQTDRPRATVISVAIVGVADAGRLYKMTKDVEDVPIDLFPAVIDMEVCYAIDSGHYR